ncbi:MAG TPA: response regulator transcription factor [Solirubrobacteraceae bacterium]|jgi:DNA-binding response OmpR family regulator|nr:response regulator transcription factor [Solirubrobacteraceae bacterium]
MSDAWIYACEPRLGETLGGQLCELGYRTLAQSIDAAPTVERLVASRTPGLVVVTSGIDAARTSELCTAVRALDGLSDVPLLCAVEETALGSGELTGDGDELLVAPWTLGELRLRIGRASRRFGLADHPEAEIVRVRGLEINLATYQVTIDGRPVDFTFMEYELLRFLVTHPNRVFAREALLNRVWGYDYYGGTRTVDVHVRRVRAKLGAEHAARLHTVRSVGYRFER